MWVSPSGMRWKLFFSVQSTEFLLEVYLFTLKCGYTLHLVINTIVILKTLNETILNESNEMTWLNQTKTFVPYLSVTTSYVVTT